MTGRLASPSTIDSGDLAPEAGSVLSAAPVEKQSVIHLA
jgi:hypothetical protein